MSAPTTTLNFSISIVLHSMENYSHFPTSFPPRAHNYGVTVGTVPSLILGAPPVVAKEKV